MSSEPIAVQELVGAQATPDGKAMLLDLKDAQGAPMRLSIPHGELMALVSLATVSHSAGMQLQQVARTLREDFQVVYWQLGRVADSKDVILDFTLKQSGTLSFRLNEDQLRELQEAFARMAGAATSAAPASPPAHPTAP